MPNDKCSKTTPGSCGVVEFLKERREEMLKLQKYLSGLAQIAGPGEKSKEIEDAETFLTKVLEDPSSAPKENPCLTVGDLLIALESLGIPVFFTLNGKESQHFCRPLNQDMIVRPTDPKKEDIECLRERTEWHKF